MNKFMKNIAVVYAFVSLFLIVWCAIHNDPQGVLCFMMSFTSLTYAIFINNKADDALDTISGLIDVVKDLSDIIKEDEERKLAELQKDIDDEELYQ